MPQAPCRHCGATDLELDGAPSGTSWTLPPHQRPDGQPCIIRVLRVVEYVGPPGKVQLTLDRSIQGRLDVPGQLTITATVVPLESPTADRLDRLLDEAREHLHRRSPPGTTLDSPPRVVP